MYAVEAIFLLVTAAWLVVTTRDAGAASGISTSER